MSQNTQKTIGKFTKIGIALAHAFLTADIKADLQKKHALLKVVSEYGNNKAQVDIILEAYANEYKTAGYNEGVVKVRKSELKAVFKAVEGQAVSGDNLAKLHAHVGGYHAFIDFARSLHHKEVTVKTPVIKEKLTDNQLATVENTLDNANIPQLSRVVNEAITRVNDKATPELAGYSQIVLINSIANQMLKNDKLDKIMLDFANDVYKSSNLLINRIESAKKVTEQAMAKATLSDVVEA